MTRVLSIPMKTPRMWLLLVTVVVSLLFFEATVYSALEYEANAHPLISSIGITILSFTICGVLAWRVWEKFDFQRGRRKLWIRLGLIGLSALSIPGWSLVPTDAIMLFGILSQTFLISSILLVLELSCVEVVLEGNVLVLTGRHSQDRVPVTNLADVRNAGGLVKNGMIFIDADTLRLPVRIRLVFQKPTVFGSQVLFWTRWQPNVPDLSWGLHANLLIHELRSLSPTATRRQLRRRGVS